MLDDSDKPAAVAETPNQDATRSRRRSKAKTAQSPPYKRTQQELAEVEIFNARLKANGHPIPRLKIKGEGTATKAAFDHPDPEMVSIRLMNAMGTADFQLARELVGQIGELCQSKGKIETGNLEFMIAAIRGIGPQDAIESMLSTQMVAIHSATMAATRRLKTADLIEQHDAALTAVNKLARTFALQMEALKKHRSTGEQTVRVVHQQVTVNNQGGQAIVAGEVQAGGGGATKNKDQSLEPNGSTQPGPAMLGPLEAVPFALSSASGSKQDRVPIPRGPSWSAEG